MLKKCDACKGSKRIMQLGGLFKDCSTCGGVGYQDKIADNETEAFLSDNKPAVKKYGRKKRGE